jgi:hypothetical protein
LARIGIARLMRSADYEVRDFGLAERLWGMTSSPVEKIVEPEQTVLVGEVADQAALVGIMNALYNSGHTVVSVEGLLHDADPHMDDTK